MKRLLLLTLALILSLAACSSPAGAGQPPTPSPAIGISPSPSPTISPAPSPTPAFIPDTDIPDIVWDEEETAIHSDCHIYEDGDHIYYTEDSEDTESLNVYSYFKPDGSIRKVSCEESSVFTLFKGKVYFIEDNYLEDDTQGSDIVSYDPATDKIKLVKELKTKIYSISGYNGGLYYTCGPAIGEDEEDTGDAVTDLYTIKTDGNGIKKIISGAASFSIYQNSIYYTVSPYGEGSALYRCGLDGKDPEQITKRAYWSFTLGNGKLFYTETDDSQTDHPYIRDLAAGSAQPMQSSYSRAFAGQYIVYLAQQDNDPGSYVYAYDTETGKTYKCLELGDYDYTITAAGQNVYVDYYDGSGSTAIDRLVIKNGKASLEPVKTFENMYEPARFAYRKPSADTVVIADGISYFSIIGGYSNGGWLTHGEAASYCGQRTTFYEYSLKGLVGEVESEKAVPDEEYGGFAYSQTSDMYSKVFDESVPFNLITPERAEKDYDYYKDPFCFTQLYSAPPERMPELTVLDDFSSIQPVIQKMVDKNLGAGKVQAEVRAVVAADIDNDREAETIVNADNYENFDPESEEYGLMYSIAAIIESDGSVVTVDENYYDPDDPSEDDSLSFSYIQNIIDLDGDGKCEIVNEWWNWEVGGTVIYKYDGKKLIEVMYYTSGA